MITKDVYYDLMKLAQAMLLGGCCEVTSVELFAPKRFGVGLDGMKVLPSGGQQQFTITGYYTPPKESEGD